MQFQESDFLFNFNKDWQIYRFDQHRFYRHLSAVGLKGVDFIGIYKNEFLMLMEIKNYNRRKASPVAPDIRDIIGMRPQLIDIFNHKLEDSMLAIKTVYKYYRRKFWYPLLSSIWKFFPFLLLKNTESYFWLRSYELLHQENKVHFVLWLETENQYPDLTATDIQALRVKIKKHASQMFAHLSPKVIVTGGGSNPYEQSLEVREIP